MILAEIFPGDNGAFPLAIGAFMILFAGQLAGMGAKFWPDAPGWRGLAACCPIAAAAGVAMFKGRGDLALAILFASSVALLALPQALAALVAPNSDAPGGARRFWPLVLPAALLPLLAGFAGNFTRLHAEIFLTEGLVLWLAWHGKSGDEPVPEFVAENANPENPARARVLSTVNMVLCAVLASAGAAAALNGTLPIAARFPTSVSLSLAPWLAPLLILPMMMTVGPLARQHRVWVSVSSSVVAVLMNLCLLLPALIFWKLHFDSQVPLVFSMVTWRVDNVVLVLLAFLLVPISLGRWKLGSAEGLTLLGFYVAYALMEFAEGRRI